MLSWRDCDRNSLHNREQDGVGLLIDVTRCTVENQALSQRGHLKFNVTYVKPHARVG